jgi:hypothetical protein
MRRMLWITAAAALVLPVALCAQEQQSQTQSQSQAQTQSDSQQASSASSQNQKPQNQKAQSQKSQDQNSQNQAPSQATPQEDSLAAAARKAREQKKDALHPTVKVFTNDDLPTGGISTVGTEKDAASAEAGKEDAAAAGPSDEKTWRARFAKLHEKLDQDQSELDVLQRELGVAQTQFYGGDPNKAMSDQMSGQPFGAEYNKKLTQVDEKKKQIEADKQAISDAEDDLRKAGGDPGWAR